jgi:hypothetical protein
MQVIYGDRAVAGSFGSRATGIGGPTAQGADLLAGFVRREAYSAET